jgi:hypothetical protein
VEVTARETAERQLLFVLNHTAEDVSIELPAGRRFWDHLGQSIVADSLTLAGYGVGILEARA